SLPGGTSGSHNALRRGEGERMVTTDVSIGLFLGAQEDLTRPKEGGRERGWSLPGGTSGSHNAIRRGEGDRVVTTDVSIGLFLGAQEDLIRPEGGGRGRGVVTSDVSKVKAVVIIKPTDNLCGIKVNRTL
ncbi:hypothetical protein ACJJTC_002362, partial [Scirpophaga incertulas]